MLGQIQKFVGPAGEVLQNAEKQDAYPHEGRLPDNSSQFSVVYRGLGDLTESTAPGASRKKPVPSRELAYSACDGFRLIFSSRP
jgi:hypothetical protein